MTRVNFGKRDVLLRRRENALVESPHQFLPHKHWRGITWAFVLRYRAPSAFPSHRPLVETLFGPRSLAELGEMPPALLPKMTQQPSGELAGSRAQREMLAQFADLQAGF